MDLSSRHAEDLIDESRLDVHVTCLKFYCDQSLDVRSELKEVILHQKGAYEIERLADVRWNESASCFEVFVEWRGFSLDESTWEPLSVIYKDCPQAVLTFFSQRKDSVSRKAVASLQAKGGM